MPSMNESTAAAAPVFVKPVSSAIFEINSVLFIVPPIDERERKASAVVARENRSAVIRDDLETVKRAQRDYAAFLAFRCSSAFASASSVDDSGSPNATVGSSTLTVGERPRSWIGLPLGPTYRA